MKFTNVIGLAGALLLPQLHSVAAFPKPITDVADLLNKRATTTAMPTTSPTPASTRALSCPTPTVPLGNGGAFATRQGRMFQIQSKTQYFAGMH